MSDSPGAAYARLCKALGRVRIDPEKERRSARDIRRLRSEVDGLKRDRAALASYGGRAYRAASARLEKAEKELARRERVHEQRGFSRAMRITRMGLRVEEVVRFSTVAAVLAALASLAVLSMLWLLSHMDTFLIIVSLVLFLGALPIAVFMWLVGYPERLARSMEMEAFGAAPEVVNYMVMSMELSPSLDTALTFAAANAEGPMANEFRDLLWKVQARKFATTEEAMVRYAADLEGMNEELRSALYNILSASREQDRDIMRSSLRRASDVVLVGTRQRVEGFAASLGTPATVLFALGIVLPMMIGSLLPMLSLGGLGQDIGEMVSVQADKTTWLPIFILSVLLMDIAFPLIAITYARSILARRPGIHTLDPSADSAPAASSMLGSFSVFTAFSVLAYLVGSTLDFWGLQWMLASMMLMLGISFGLYLVLRQPSLDTSRSKSMERLEDQMPDMLFQLGSRLGDGLSLERAMEDVAGSMGGTEIGAFLGQAISRMRRSGMGLHDVLLGDDGLLIDHPSRKLAASMKLVLEASGKDPATAGNMLVTMSNHMRELANADKEMRLKLRSTIDSMKNTALLFAPVIMGVTVGLYMLLGGTFGDLGGGSMPPELFLLVIGAYLLLTVSTIMYFSSGIERGRGRWRNDVATALPVSALIFSLASFGSLLAFS